jgi:predicted house-cleaning noncanonical NTP pyrophosphatase (MazG superfamily)
VPFMYLVKLVRARSAEHLADGGNVVYAPFQGTLRELYAERRKKLGEEVIEFIADPSAEELADVQSALNACAQEFGGNSRIDAIAAEKAERRGMLDSTAMYVTSKTREEFDASA